MLVIAVPRAWLETCSFGVQVAFVVEIGLDPHVETVFERLAQRSVPRVADHASHAAIDAVALAATVAKIHVAAFLILDPEGGDLTLATRDPLVHLPSDVARRYFVEDLPGAILTGARLQGVLRTIDDGEALSVYSLAFLEKEGLLSLHALASGLMSSEEFRRTAAAEQNARVIVTARQATAAAAAAEKRAAERAAAARRLFAEMESDPVRRRRREAQQLHERFGIGHVDTAGYARVIKLLKRLEGGTRLSPQEVIWLSAETECWTPAVRAAHHRLEAIALTEEWKGTNDPWTAINACSLWRKAEAPQEAIGITTTLLALPGLSSKLQSALRTTRGGALRDLGRLQEASDLGYEAHRLRPTDFRPCTLLGAISMTQGDFAAGHEWYARAEELGAEPRHVDQDIRSVLHRCAPEIGVALRESLLARNPLRFAWVRAHDWRSPPPKNSSSTM